MASSSAPQLDYAPMGDDLIDAINHMMSFLTAVVTSRYPATNNQLRTSSNPRQQATINNGRVTIQPIQGRQNFVSAGSSRPFTSGSSGAPGKQRVIVCYNCKGEGHMSKQCIKPNRKRDAEWFKDKCTKPKRKRDAEWFKDKVLLVQAQANGQIALMANLSYYGSDNLAESNTEIISDSNIISYSQYMNESQYNTVQNSTLHALQDDLILSVIEQLKTQVVNCTKINQDNKQVNELLTAELERELALEKQVKELNDIVFKKALGFQNPCYLKKAQKLKPKLYDGRIIEKSDVVVIPNTKETLMLAEENFKTRFVPQTELSAEQAFWSQYSVQTNEPNLSATTTIVEVPKELPKVSMRNTLSSPESAPTFAELFKINDLKAQAQAKDTVILKLKEKLRSLNGDVNDRKVKREVEEIETLNIELDHKILHRDTYCQIILLLIYRVLLRGHLARDRVRDSGYMADVEVGPKETRVKRVTHPAIPEDIPEPA
uniref:CCHC-type domain-containing protein n=1 Tax=Tanacetum cinerariifolium TaxID=118510 RepID=A0A699IS34_TANCI|nr:hypothetical protein [Tanacetum cinerariifolium]